MNKDPNFSYQTADIHGTTPDFGMIGNNIRHTGNGHIYTITGFAWLGETDEWGFVHKRADNEVVCCRPLSHLTGYRENGRQRYINV